MFDINTINCSILQKIFNDFNSFTWIHFIEISIHDFQFKCCEFLNFLFLVVEIALHNFLWRLMCSTRVTAKPVLRNTNVREWAQVQIMCVLLIIIISFFVSSMKFQAGSINSLKLLHLISGSFIRFEWRGWVAQYIGPKAGMKKNSVEGGTEEEMKLHTRATEFKTMFHIKLRWKSGARSNRKKRYIKQSRFLTLILTFSMAVYYVCIRIATVAAGFFSFRCNSTKRVLSTKSQNRFFFFSV